MAKFVEFKLRHGVSRLVLLYDTLQLDDPLQGTRQAFVLDLAVPTTTLSGPDESNE